MLPIVVVEGPSGVGKDSVIRKLCELNPGVFLKMPSITSRERREGETHGVTYFYVDKEAFEKMIKEGDVFEHTERHGTYRGMSKKIIDDILSCGLIPVKDCDWVGTMALRKEYKDRVLTIFINAPREEIIKRIKERGGNEQDIIVRIKDYDDKIKEINNYDHVVDNIVVEDAANEVCKLVESFCKNLK